MYVHTKSCTTMFLVVLFIIAKMGEQSACQSTNEWVTVIKWNVIHQKKKEKLILATIWMKFILRTLC